jgi:predicted permease
MLTEALLLTIFGIIIGVGVGEALLRVFVSLAPSGIPYIHQAQLDGRVLAFAIAIAIVCGLVFGSAPFWSHELRRQRAIRTVAGPGRARIRQVLLVAQLSVTLVLLAAASLLLQTARNLQSQSLGIRTGQLVTATVHFARQSYPDGTKKMQFANRLEERLKRLPGVEEVAISDSVPPGGLEHDHIFGAIALDGKPKPEGGTGGTVAWRWVTPSYFPSLGIRIVKGNNFTEEERDSNDHFLILSETMAARLFPGEDPIGKRVDPNSLKIWYTVVGVAANAKNGGLAIEDRPEYYRLWRNRPEDWNWGLPGVGVLATFILRSPADPASLASLVRHDVSDIDGSMPVEFETLREHVSSLAERPRFEAALLSLFAGFAVALAAIGLYGVIAFIVSRRTVEIAVRMALGAGRKEILKLIGREGAKVIAAAIVLGAAGALAVSRAFATLLFGVRAGDAVTLLLSVAVLLVVAAAAMLIPLRRALSVDPMRALRYE